MICIYARTYVHTYLSFQLSAPPFVVAMTTVGKIQMHAKTTYVHMFLCMKIQYALLLVALHMLKIIIVM